MKSLMYSVFRNALLSPRLFCKATEATSGVFKSVSAVNNVEILSLCLLNHKNTEEFENASLSVFKLPSKNSASNKEEMQKQTCGNSKVYQGKEWITENTG